MKRAILIIRLTLLVTALTSVLIACSNDYNPPPPDPLEGDYTGFIYYQVGTQTPDSQAVSWTFTASSFAYSLDTNLWSSANRRFCDAWGTYTLTDAVVFDQDPHWVPVVVCDSARNLNGRFVIVARSAGHLKLVQKNGNITVTIDLHKI